ncbi:thiamine pyrophosphokinase 1 [Parachaetomium inaequale]|uniref:Thiamine pyrophosphokinase n=1 Tax=Parachaetomium inaequale TaxID=2588326 RepID=A0AAN6SSG4_9PEZI|nr:thiamine pyrophosphokinase 1 [Parachaetomium inaequale]
MSTQNTAETAQPGIFEWHPAELIRRRLPSRHETGPDPASDSNSARFALIVLNQPLHTHLGVVRQLWDNAHIRIAADGGANALYEAAGQHGDSSFDDLAVIIGDLDSLSPAAQSYYESRDDSTGQQQKTQVIRDPDQESTDFGKAVQYIRRTTTSDTHQTANANANAKTKTKPLDIVAVGGLGGRVDQGLSQLHHLYLFQTDPRYADGRMYLFSGESLTFLLKPGKHRIRVRDSPAGEREDVFGKHVGILPVGGPSSISTAGLEWDVRDWETAFGGRVSTSNHVLPETEVVEVATTREVLFTIALRGV